MAPEKVLELRRKVAAINMAAEQDIAATVLPSKGYLICSTQRSGSAYLASLLDKTNLAGRPMEYFNDVYIEAFCRRFAFKNIDRQKYIFELQRLRTSPNGVFGAKAHLWQLQFWSGEKTLTAMKTILSAFDHLIFIRRRNPLAQAISLDRALQTGHWSSQHTKLADEPAFAPVFDFSRIAKALSEVCVAENAWMALFQTLALSPIEVYYEDLVETLT